MMDSGLISMQGLIILIAGVVGVSVLVAGVAMQIIINRRSRSWQRVKELYAPPGAQGDIADRVKTGGISFLTRLATPAKPKSPWQMSKLRRDLQLAGFYSSSAINVYLGLKMLLMLLYPGMVLISPASSMIPQQFLPGSLAMAAGLGFLMPSIFLDKLKARRGDRISRELPDVLDLLVIAVEAGLGLDAAIRRVAKEVKQSAPTLARELNLVSLELKAGIPRHLALRNLATRCGVDEVTSLTSMLIQADRFGVSVGRSLRVHSDAVRTKRRQRTEEKAAKIPLKLLFPVLFLVFPAIMVVMAGPAIIKVSESIVK